MDAVESEVEAVNVADVVFESGDDFNEASAVVQLWLVLDYVERVAYAGHPALMSLLQRQVISAAQHRKSIFEWDGDQLVWVNDEHESVEAVEPVAAGGGAQESDEEEDI